jgi:hypothetical protein
VERISVKAPTQFSLEVPENSLASIRFCVGNLRHEIFSGRVKVRLLKTTITGRAEKRKASTGLQSSSPTKKPALSRKPQSPMKPALSPKTASMSRSGRKKKGKKGTVTEEQHTHPQETTTSSPPKTHKSPSGALKLGLNKGTAKSLLKHSSKITPLYKMLYEFAQIVVDKQLRSGEEFKPILDELAGQLVNLLSSEVPFSFFLSFFPLSPSLSTPDT